MRHTNDELAHTRHCACMLGVLALLALPACAHHVQLQFLAANAAAESYQCSAMTETKAETTAPACKQQTVIDQTIENQAHTTHVIIPDCASNKYYRITIVDADSSSPTAYVTCGQNAHVHEN